MTTNHGKYAEGGGGGIQSQFAHLRNERNGWKAAAAETKQVWAWVYSRDIESLIRSFSKFILFYFFMRMYVYVCLTNNCISLTANAKA